MTCYVYIPIAGENKISTFTLNPDTGKLTFERDVATGGGPGPLAIDPESKFLYAGLRSTQEVASFSIDPSTGDLSPIGSVSLESDPCYIATDGKAIFCSPPITVPERYRCIPSAKMGLWVVPPSNGARQRTKRIAS